MDDIILSPTLHRALGDTVLTVLLATFAVVGYLAWRRRPLSRVAKGLVILSQLVLMAQALVGIKLLDQGLGVMQLYVHYLGGLGPLLFFMLTYWFPGRTPERQTRWTAAALVGGFLFALMAYTIGGSFANGRLG